LMMVLAMKEALERSGSGSRPKLLETGESFKSIRSVFMRSVLAGAH
jgi:hypothetical protein